MVEKACHTGLIVAKFFKRKDSLHVIHSVRQVQGGMKGDEIFDGCIKFE
jgi:hypothetical protein